MLITPGKVPGKVEFGGKVVFWVPRKIGVRKAGFWVFWVTRMAENSVLAILGLLAVRGIRRGSV